MTREDPIRFAIIGTGWRTQFMLRISAAAPERLQVVAVVARSKRSGEKAESFGVPIVSTIDEALQLRPEFVVAAVSWDPMPEVITELVRREVRVLAETPPAPTMDGLRQLWSEVGGSGLVQVAEQYLLMPGHAARSRVVEAGTIGVPTAVEVASTHLYHATSMIRGFLDVGMAPATVNARAFTAPLLDPLSPSGWAENPEPRPRTTTIATLDFGEGGMGLYNFVENQWWNPLLARRVTIRGSLGEITDDQIRRWSRDGVVPSELMYRRSGIDMNLEGNDLISISHDGAVIYRNEWVGTRLSEDDIAVAEILLATGRWARGEAPPPYPLAEACQDHALGLAIGESAKTGRDVHLGSEPWSAIEGTAATSSQA